MATIVGSNAELFWASTYLNGATRDTKWVKELLGYLENHNTILSLPDNSDEKQESIACFNPNVRFNVFAIRQKKLNLWTAAMLANSVLVNPDQTLLLILGKRPKKRQKETEKYLEHLQKCGVDICWSTQQLAVALIARYVTY